MEDLTKFLLVCVLLAIEPLSQGFKLSWKHDSTWKRNSAQKHASTWKRNLAQKHDSTWKRDAALKRASILGLLEPQNVEPGKELFFTNDGLEPITRAHLGENLVLTCEAGGEPVPFIHWLHKGRVINQSGARSIDDDVIFERPAQEALHYGYTKSRLAIDCASREDAGEYTCVAETSSASSSQIRTSTFVNIGAGEDTLSACLLDSLSKVKPPMVYMWTVQRLEYEGNDVQLFCRATDRRNAKITWYDRTNSKIVNDSNYKILDNGDLVISEISWMEHMGSYKCEAENDGGIDTVSPFLYPTQ